MCLTPKCKKQKAKKSNYCHSCALRRWAENNPVKYAYFVLRNNAKRRHKQFTITFEQFTEFINTTRYMKNRGREANSYHIDRIDETKGYIPGNLQVLTNTQNMAKRVVYYGRNEMNKPIFKTQTNGKPENSTSEEQYPF